MEETKPVVKAPLRQLQEAVMQLDSDVFDFDQVEPHMRDYLSSLVTRLGRICQQIEENYVQILPMENQVWDEEVPTTAQGVALARFLRGHFRDPSHASAFVSRGGAGLGNNYLYVRFGDGYEGGIDRDGRTST